jgi:hypothetical protein
MVMTLVAVLLLMGSSWTLGTVALSRTTWLDLRPYERAALRLTAGLGLTALALSLAAVTGWFSRATPVMGLLAATGGILVFLDHVRARRDPARRSAVTRSDRVTALVALACAAVACLGAIAPVTDDDALAYVIPIARRIAQTGVLRVWPDQARSMWPQSQEVLLAYVLHVGGDKLGAVTALEWLLCVGVVSALARRVCERIDHIGAAMIVGLGAPVLAFQVASAKEDLLLLAASSATALCLAGNAEDDELAAAGLFAGIAAGAKYSGALIAVAAIAWPIVHRRQRRFRAAAIIALCAATSGGLWYALNLWRYGNPVAPFIGGAPGTPLTAAVINAFVDQYGGSHNLVGFVIAPIRIFTEPSLFGGRANLYNPLLYAGVAGLFSPVARRRGGPVFLMAAVLYVGWFFTLQNARLLLPGAVLLAPAAADRLVPLMRGRRSVKLLALGMAAVSVGVVLAVGAVRATRYMSRSAEFLERETSNYADIQWMNAHLDREHHRVASDHKVLGYLSVPAIVLDPTYQIEISQSEMNDADRFLKACRRQRITHLFGNAESFLAVQAHLRVLYENTQSRIGGARFFREPPTEPTAVFEILQDGSAGPAIRRSGTDF